jgi:hypothetical protein
MNVKIKLLIILLFSLTLGQVRLKGQAIIETERTIYLMRAKQFYGSGAKMDLIINGKLFHKIKSGTRLIIKTNTNVPLSIQIIYPIIKSNKSKVLNISPDNASEVYIDLFYWGEGYNPFKHAGVLNPVGGTPEFNIEIVQMTLDEGKKKFYQSEVYKDNNKIIEKYFSIE